MSSLLRSLEKAASHARVGCNTTLRSLSSLRPLRVASKASGSRAVEKRYETLSLVHSNWATAHFDIQNKTAAFYSFPRVMTTSKLQALQLADSLIAQANHGAKFIAPSNSADDNTAADVIALQLADMLVSRSCEEAEEGVQLSSEVKKDLRKIKLLEGSLQRNLLSPSASPCRASTVNLSTIQSMQLDKWKGHHLEHYSRPRNRIFPLFRYEFAAPHTETRNKLSEAAVETSETLLRNSPVISPLMTIKREKLPWDSSTSQHQKSPLSQSSILRKVVYDAGATQKSENKTKRTKNQEEGWDRAEYVLTPAMVYKSGNYAVLECQRQQAQDKEIRLSNVPSERAIPGTQQRGLPKDIQEKAASIAQRNLSRTAFSQRGFPKTTTLDPNETLAKLQSETNTDTFNLPRPFARPAGSGELALKVLQIIDRRETAVERLAQVVYRLTSPDTSANEVRNILRTKLRPVNLRATLDVIRKFSVGVLLAIDKWRTCLENVNYDLIAHPVITAKTRTYLGIRSPPRPFLWRGFNYASKMTRDLKFLDRKEIPRRGNLLERCGFVSAIDNPLLLPVTLAECTLRTPVATVQKSKLPLGVRTFGGIAMASIREAASILEEEVLHMRASATETKLPSRENLAGAARLMESALKTKSNSHGSSVVGNALALSRTLECRAAESGHVAIASTLEARTAGGGDSVALKALSFADSLERSSSSAPETCSNGSELSPASSARSAKFNRTTSLDPIFQHNAVRISESVLHGESGHAPAEEMVSKSHQPDPDIESVGHLKEFRVVRVPGEFPIVRALGSTLLGNEMHSIDITTEKKSGNVVIFAYGRDTHTLHLNLWQDQTLVTDREVDVMQPALYENIISRLTLRRNQDRRDRRLPQEKLCLVDDKIRKSKRDNQDIPPVETSNKRGRVKAYKISTASKSSRLRGRRFSSQKIIVKPSTVKKTRKSGPLRSKYQAPRTVCADAAVGIQRVVRGRRARQKVEFLKEVRLLRNYKTTTIVQ